MQNAQTKTTKLQKYIKIVQSGLMTKHEFHKTTFDSCFNVQTY